MRIESIENLIQLGTIGICSVISAQHYYSSKRQEWAMMFLAAFVYFLGDLYWQLYLIFFGETPYYSHIPYLSWYASYLFLTLLIVGMRGDSRIKVLHPLMLVIPLFTVGMAIFFMQRGDYISNIICAVIMSILMLRATEGLMMAKKEGLENSRLLYITILALCVTEYASWVFSSFWTENSISNPYFWADSVLSIIFLLFPFALRKAVDR